MHFKCVLSLKYWFAIFAVSIPTKALWHNLKCTLSLKYCIWFAIFAVSIPTRAFWYILMHIVTKIIYWLIVYSNQHIFFLFANISFSHTLNALVPYGYVVILSDVCVLLSSSLLSAILSTSSVYTVWSLLNLCCDFITISLFKKESL